MSRKKQLMLVFGSFSVTVVLMLTVFFPIVGKQDDEFFLDELQQQTSPLIENDVVDHTVVDDADVESSLLSSHMVGGDLHLVFFNPDNEVIWVDHDDLSITISDDTVVVEDYVPSMYFVVHVGVDSDMYKFGDRGSATSWYPCGTAKNDSSTGTINWNYPDRVYTTDNSRTYCIGSGSNSESYWLNCTNFSIVVPNGHSITGVQCEIERSGSLTSQIYDVKLYLVKGGVIQTGGTNMADTGTLWPGSSADANASYGGDNETWGVSLTESDVESSGFGVALSVKMVNNGNRPLVDLVKIRVYTEAPAFVNTPPSLIGSSENPLDTSTGVHLSLQNFYSRFNITVADMEDVTPGQDMNITWRTNESSVWQDMGTNTSVGNGTYYCMNVSWVDTYSTKYYWSVNVSDGYNWTNATYSFTTASNVAPSINESTESPTSGSTDVADAPTLSAWIQDDNADTMTYWINVSTDGNHTYWCAETGTSGNATIDYAFSNATYDNASYYWTVSVVDGNGGSDIAYFNFQLSQNGYVSTPWYVPNTLTFTEIAGTDWQNSSGDTTPVVGSVKSHDYSWYMKCIGLSAGENTGYVNFTDFDIVVPAGSVVKGVQFIVSTSSNNPSNTYYNYSMLLDGDSVPTGDDIILYPPPVTFFSTSPVFFNDTMPLNGTTSYLWGASVTEAMVEDEQFGLSMHFGVSGNAEIRIDYVGCIIYYDVSPYINVTVNFAGNLSEWSRPDYIHPHSDPAITTPVSLTTDGYYVNNSYQTSNFMYVNVSVGASSAITNVWLNWRNGSSYTNWTYPMISKGSGFYEFNTSGNITNIKSGYWYSFDVVANTSSMSVCHVWNHTQNVALTAPPWRTTYNTTRFVQLSHTPISFVYEPLYPYYDTWYATGDAYKDIGRADQGSDGTMHDTMMLRNITPSSTMMNGFCATFVALYYDEPHPVVDTLENVYYHMWIGQGLGLNNWSMNFRVDNLTTIPSTYYTDGDSLPWNNITIPLNSTTNVTYNISGLWSSYAQPVQGGLNNNVTYNLKAGIFNCNDFPVTANSVYKVVLSIGAWDASGYGYYNVEPSIISNRSISTFFIINVPSDILDGTDNTTDTDADGLSDCFELNTTWGSYTNPFLEDTDGDGYDDAYELLAGTDPNDYTDFGDIPLPSIIINFAGNLSDSGGPYWSQWNETVPLAGVWENGYYTNDSWQSEDWIYINCTITDADSAYLHILQIASDYQEDWDNSTNCNLINTGGDYWEINTTDKFSPSSMKNFSFDINASNAAGETIVQWNKTGLGGDIVRRFIRMDCEPINISYKPYYLFFDSYIVGDTSKHDRLHHDQGPDGSLTDTGYLRLATPTEDVEVISCSGYVGAWMDETECPETISINNYYYHFWYSSKYDSEQSPGPWPDCSNVTGWGMERENVSSVIPVTDLHILNNPLSGPLYYDQGSEPHDDYYSMYANIFNNISDDSVTFTDNNIYEFVLKAGESYWPSILSNRSMVSFVIFNIPPNATLNSTDWSGVGGAVGDRDGDTLNDWNELYTYYTNPFLSDTDDDGYNDSYEILAATDPNDYTDFGILREWQQVQDWNITLSDTSAWNLVADWNLTLSNSSSWNLIADWNITLDNTSSWVLLQDWNISLSDVSGWSALADWNITLNDASEYTVVSDWNISLSNSSDHYIVNDWNLTLHNISGWYGIADWNLTLSNSTVWDWHGIDDWNISLSDISIWNSIMDWNLTIGDTSSWSNIIDWNLTLSNATDFVLLQDWNLTLSDTSGYNIIDTWNLTLSNNTVWDWHSIVDWNLTLSNSSSWFGIADWNLTLNNDSGWSLIADWNLTLSNISVYLLVQDWNLSLTNTTGYNAVDMWNVTLSNSTSWNLVSDWNLTLSNNTVWGWQQVQDWNTTLSNSSAWSLISDWNVSLSNLSGYHVVNLWNTTLSNTTVFSNVETWNLTLSNTTDYLGIADWNITLSNISGWFIVDTWNLTLSDTSSYGVIDLWNLTVGNTSSWMSVQDWNLTLSNISGYVSIDVWNLTLSNTTVWDWYLISDWNLTLSNVTVWGWNLIADWNLTLSNTTIWDWYLVEQWNITLSNNTEYGVVDLWNTTLSNDTVWSVISDWNISLSNTSDYISIDDWNLTLSNITVWDWYTIIDWNLTLTNSSGWDGIADWNLTLSNASDYLLIDDWNITLGDISGWSGISDWNLTLSNFSVWEWYAIIDWNLTLSNTSSWHELSDWNLTLSNTTEWGWNIIEDWNLTLSNTSSYHMIADWNITLVNISEYSIIDDWNITLSNNTVWDWHGVDDWNLTIGNITSYTLIDDWNITLKNTSGYVSIADWNLTLSNTSEYAWHLISDWNLTLSNTSQILSIDTWNLTLSNHTDVELIELWNLTLSNTSDEISIIDVFPENNSLYSSIQPTLYFTLRNPKGLLMNYTIYIGNSSGNCTELLSSASGVSNGTYHYVNYFTASEYNTFYWWSVNVSDSSGSVNESFVFRPVRGVGQVVSTPDVGVGWLLFVVVGVCLFLYRKRKSV